MIVLNFNWTHGQVPRDCISQSPLQVGDLLAESRTKFSPTLSPYWETVTVIVTSLDSVWKVLVEDD